MYLILLCCLVQACDESEDQEELPKTNVNYDLIVLNEGNFRSANASVDFYSSSANERVANVFQNSNGSRPLGDVAQSMIQHLDKYYVVVNNSSKIEVLDAVTLKSVGQITGLNSPRYVLPIENNLAYVSDIYEDKLYKVDLLNFSIVGQLNYGGWIEEMVKVNQYAFLCNRDSNQVIVLDTRNDSLVKKIATNAFPNSLRVDKNDNVWVSCSGNTTSYAALMQIDGDSLNVLKTMEASSFDQSFGELEINGAGNQLYYLNQDVYQLSIANSTLPSSPIILQNDRLFYALGIHPNSNEIYVCDAIDYVQSGIVFRYSPQGQQIASFRSGIIPGFFFFR